MRKNTFVSNVTGREYKSSGMSCSTDNVVYLVSCKQCGIQYVGETSQALCSRRNNHRNRVKQMCDLYIYQHFNSDGHSAEDIMVMPIEKNRG